VKNIVKNARGGDFQSVYDEIILAFDSVSLENIVNYYGKCIFPDGILPEINIEMNDLIS
jgi:hypothetical protein